MTIWVLSVKEGMMPFMPVWWFKEFPQFGDMKPALNALMVDGVTDADVVSMLEEQAMIKNEYNVIHMFILEEKEEGEL